jgi:hypothetical protein
MYGDTATQPIGKFGALKNDSDQQVTGLVLEPEFFQPWASRQNRVGRLELAYRKAFPCQQRE